MTGLIRWFKFNLVGALGMAMQLITLALLNRLFPGRYLYTTTVAIETTLLHNFIWHLDFTWRDRRSQSTVLAQLLRFHLSNGVVSLAGNLILMRLLVRSAHLPIVAANAIAILCCSVVNFNLSNRWAFADPIRTGCSRASGEPPVRASVPEPCPPEPRSPSARSPWPPLAPQAVHASPPSGPAPG